MTVSGGTLLVNGSNPGPPATADGFYNASSITINNGASLVTAANTALLGYPTTVGKTI